MRESDWARPPDRHRHVKPASVPGAWSLVPGSSLVPGLWSEPFPSRLVTGCESALRDLSTRNQAQIPPKHEAPGTDTLVTPWRRSPRLLLFALVVDVDDERCDQQDPVAGAVDGGQPDGVMPAVRIIAIAGGKQRHLEAERTVARDRHT